MSPVFVCFLSVVSFGVLLVCMWVCCLYWWAIHTSIHAYTYIRVYVYIQYIMLYVSVGVLARLLWCRFIRDVIYIYLYIYILCFRWCAVLSPLVSVPG